MRLIVDKMQDLYFKSDKAPIVLSALISIHAAIVILMNSFDNPMFFLATPILAIVIFLVILFFLKILEESKLEILPVTGQNHKFRVELVVLFILLAGQIMFWLAYYPGGFNLDAYGQWDQVHGTEPLDNWHPIITTCIYWLLTRIVDSAAFCVFFQLIVYSFSMSILMGGLYDAGYEEWLIYTVSAIMTFNPAICMNNVCLIKDVYFSIGIIWIMYCLLRIYVTDGGWLLSDIHITGLSFAFLFVTLVRHNGFLFVVPVMVCVCVCYRKYIKKVIVSSLIVLCVVGVLLGPVFSHAKVYRHSNVIGEISGVPMGIMINSYLNDPGNTPDEVIDLLEGIATRDEWEEHYVVGEWDSCKWEFGGAVLLKQMTGRDLIDYTLKTIWNSPLTSYQSFRENTRIVWQILGRADWSPWVYVESPNEYGIEEKHVSWANSLVSGIESLSYSPIGIVLIWSNGVLLLVLHLMVAYVAILKQYKKLIMILPVIVYDFLTMLLLSGPNHRYFYFTSVVFLPIVMIMVLHFEIEDLQEKVTE